MSFINKMSEVSYGQSLIQRTVSAILNNKGRLKYTDIHAAVQCTTS